MGILARVPLASGALTGTWDEHKTFTPDDWHANVFTGETLRRTLIRVNKLKEIAADVGSDMLEFAIRFCITENTHMLHYRNPSPAVVSCRAGHCTP